MIVRRLKEESGIAIVVALITLMISLLLTAAVVSAAIDESTGSRHDTAEKRAFEASQAGLQQTLHRLNMLINTNLSDPSQLSSSCMGSNANVDVSGNFSFSSGSRIELPTVYAGLVCPPDTESLGNGAFYTSWTSVAVTNAPLNCAGVTIAPSLLIGERCVASKGMICPASYTSVGQLPCPNPVIHRVEERVSANTGKPDFPAGVVGLQGLLFENSSRILGTVATNAQLDLENTAYAQGPAELAPGAPNPIIGNPGAFLGTCGQITYQSHIWPPACVLREAQGFTVPAPQYPPVMCGVTTPTTTCPATDGSWYSAPDGDQNISNAFLNCAQTTPATCVGGHDTFTGKGTCTVAPRADSTGYCWNPYTRTLILPNNVKWTLYGSQYDLCGLELNGNSSAQLGTGVHTAIYIDSELDQRSDAPNCPSGSGYVNFGNQSQFSNLSVSAVTGNPDTTALQFYVYGMASVSHTATWNNNDCTAYISAHNPSPTSPCVVLGQQGNFYGTFFAANSDILVANGGNSLGAVNGRTVVFNNTGTFTMDPLDSQITTYSLGLYFRTSWGDCTAKQTVASNPMSGC
jgi:hypothetical protein